MRRASSLLAQVRRRARKVCDAIRRASEPLSRAACAQCRHDDDDFANCDNQSATICGTFEHPMSIQYTSCLYRSGHRDTCMWVTMCGICMIHPVLGHSDRMIIRIRPMCAFYLDTRRRRRRRLAATTPRATPLCATTVTRRARAQRHARFTRRLHARAWGGWCVPTPRERARKRRRESFSRGPRGTRSRRVFARRARAGECATRGCARGRVQGEWLHALGALRGDDVASARVKGDRGASGVARI